MAVGTMVMAAAAAYSPQVDGRASGARDGSPSSSPVMASTSIAPLRRTSALSSEPWIQSRHRERSGLPTTMRFTLCAWAYARISSATLWPLTVTARPPSCSANSSARSTSSRSRRAEALVPRGFHVQRHPLGVEPGRHPSGGPHQPNRGPARSDADQQPLRRRPGVPDAALRHVAAHLRVHPLGRAAERQLPQGDQVPLAEELLDRAGRLLRHVDLAFAEPLLQHVGGDIHQLDLVGLLQHRVGQGLPHLHAGDLGDDVVQALDVLDVERGVDVDARARAAPRRPASAWRGGSRVRWCGPARPPGAGRGGGRSPRRGRTPPAGCRGTRLSGGAAPPALRPGGRSRPGRGSRRCRRPRRDHRPAWPARPPAC